MSISNSLEFLNFKESIKQHIAKLSIEETVYIIEETGKVLFSCKSDDLNIPFLKYIKSKKTGVLCGFLKVANMLFSGDISEIYNFIFSIALTKFTDSKEFDELNK